MHAKHRDTEANEMWATKKSIERYFYMASAVDLQSFAFEKHLSIVSYNFQLYLHIFIFGMIMTYDICAERLIYNVHACARLSRYLYFSFYFSFILLPATHGIFSGAYDVRVNWIYGESVNRIQKIRCALRFVYCAFESAAVRVKMHNTEAFKYIPASTK